MEGTAFSMDYGIAQDITVREINGELYILQRGTARVHCTNTTGTRIWAMIKAGKPAHFIAERLCTEYEVSKDQAEEDVKIFLAELKNRSLIGNDE